MTSDYPSTVNPWASVTVARTSFPIKGCSAHRHSGRNHLSRLPIRFSRTLILSVEKSHELANRGLRRIIGGHSTRGYVVSEQWLRNSAPGYSVDIETAHPASERSRRIDDNGWGVAGW
jgi:hypothetical protein